VTALAPLPARGRRFEGSRTVRLGDAAVDGLLRLDGLARFLQDIAADDAAEVGLRAASWVVRRTQLVLEGRPTFGERISLTTFCGGLGSRWAERRTSVVGPASRIEASSLWVHLDEVTGRPTALPPIFLEAYGEAAGDRTASSRLSLPAPPAGEVTRPWALRRTDFDVLGHVNNAAYWSAVEEELTAGVGRGSVLLEYRTPIEPGASVSLVHDRASASAWLVGDAGVHAAARLTPAG
jgi:acyl-ACP thioesterase